MSAHQPPGRPVRVKIVAPPKKVTILSTDYSEEVEVEEQKEDFESTVIPTPVLDRFIYQLREKLRGEKRDNNCFRFLLDADEKTPIEKSKAYLPSPLAVGLLALHNVIDTGYDIEETYNDAWDDMEQASEIEICVAYETTVTAYEGGVLELVNKNTQNRLTLQIVTDGLRQWFKVYSHEGNGECKEFLKQYEKIVKDQNLYKNKTFALENHYNAGLLPKFIKPIAVNAEDVVVDGYAEDVITANVFNIFERADEYKEAKIPLKRGVLIEGPPGNGKSTLVKYIETRLKDKVTFIYVTDGVIRNASDIGEIYALARQFAPSVVVFEDIDTIGQAREQFGSGNFTSELLGQLDGLEVLEGVVTIATTNHPDKIDDALKNRPGRFDRRLNIDRPGPKLREDMLLRFLQEKDVPLDGLHIDELVKKTDKFSGAMLKEAIITAKINVLTENLGAVDQKQLLRAIESQRDNYHDSVISKKQNEVGFRAR